MSKYWQGEPIFVIGLGVGTHHANLSKNAKNALLNADIILSESINTSYLMFNTSAKQITLPENSDDLWDILHEFFHKKIVILSTGDPLFYGVGEVLLSKLSKDELIFETNISVIQLAFSRIGQPWHNIKIINLQNDSPNILRSKIIRGSWFAVLAAKDNPPNLIAAELCVSDYESSPMWIFEHLGTDKEQITFDYADGLIKSDETFADDYIAIFQVSGNGNVFSEFIGMNDDIFHKEEKRELCLNRHERIFLLSFLSLRNDEVGWMIGAGVGEFAVEWAKNCPTSIIYAVEPSKKRGSILLRNSYYFGVSENLFIHIASAPPILDKLPDDPDMVYVAISGLDSRFEVILDVCWERLKPGGKLLVTAKSENTKYSLYKYADEVMNDIAEMKVYSFTFSELHSKNRRQYLETDTPIFIALWEKPWEKSAT